VFLFAGVRILDGREAHFDFSALPLSRCCRPHNPSSRSNRMARRTTNTMAEHSKESQSLTPMHRADETAWDATYEGLVNGFMTLVPTAGALYVAMRNPTFVKRTNWQSRTAMVIMPALFVFGLTGKSIFLCFFGDILVYPTPHLLFRCIILLTMVLSLSTKSRETLRAQNERNRRRKQTQERYSCVG